ncbi:unnamed protein product [Aphanomyces euteiches]
MSPDLFFFSSLEPAEEPSPRDKPYVQASKDGDVDALIKFLAEDNFNPNAITPGIVLSLMFAAEEGYLDVIKILRDEVELDEQQLHIGYLTACARDQIEIVEYVLATPGVNINVTVGELHAMNENPPDEWIETREATRLFREDIRRELFQRGVQSAEIPSISGLTLATLYGHAALVEWMLQQPNIKINQSRVAGVVPLVSALTNNHDNIVQMLLNHPETNLDEANHIGETPLIVATKKNESAVVSFLLEHKVNVNATDSMGRTPLIHACTNEAAEIVETLLRHPDVNVNAVDKTGQSALSILTTVENIALMKRLMAHRNIDVPPLDGMTKLMHAAADASLQDVDTILRKSVTTLNSANFVDARHLGYTAFMYACQGGFTPIVRRFLEEPSLNVHQQNKAFETGFVLACKEGRTDIANLLLQIPGLNDEQLALGLFWASRNGFSLIVQSLLQTSVNVNTPVFIPGLEDMTTLTAVIKSSNRNGRTSLQVACRRDHRDVVALLLQHPDIFVNVEDPLGITPLITACIKKDKALVDLLLQHPDIDVNQRDYSDRTALIVATQYGQSEIVRALLKHPEIWPNCPDHMGNTPLMVACARGNEAIVGLLLQHPDVHTTVANMDNDTPLSVAISCEYDKIVKMLLMDKNKFVFQASCESNNVGNIAQILTKSMLDPNDLNENGRTGLMTAATAGSIDVVDYLLDDPTVDINFKNGKGDTAFIFACEQGNVSVVTRFLQSPNLDFGYKKKSGLTAFLYACLEGQDEVVALLAQCDQLDDEQLHIGFVAACSRGHLSVVKYFLDCHDINVNYGCRELFAFAEYSKAMCEKNEWRDWHDMVEAFREMFVAGLHILGLELPDTLAVTGLFLAVVGGHTSIVKCLVEQPAIQVNQVEGTLGVPLVDAVKNSFTEITEALMTHSSIVVDEPNIKGETALMYAAEKNDTKLVENLLQASYVDASRECAAEASALVRACAAGAVYTASILLSRPDIKVNHVDKEGRSALSIATSTGDQDLLKLILNHPNVDVPDELGRTELMKACAKGAVDQVDKLLQRSNVSVNSVNFLSGTHNGYTPLMYACEAGHIDVVRRLLKEPKLRLTYKTTKKESALVVASQNGHDAIVQLLLEHSQTYDEDDLDLSLFWACRNGYPNVVNILMKTSVDVNKFTDALGEDDVSWRHSARLFRKGKTPLEVACRRNHPDVVGLLLTHDKISVNVTDDEGFTPLMTACAKGYDEVAKMLLRHRSLRVNKRGAAGDTALGIAVQSGYPSIVHLLLQHPEIDVNIKDEIGNTPIILSITTGDVAIVQELLQHPKIDLKVKNKALLTAMDMASALGNAKIQRLVRAKYRELKKNRSREHKEGCIIS